MSDDVGRLQTDSLFLGLTRPTMVFGVTYSWLMLEGMVCLLYFVNASSGRFYAVLYGAALHLVGVLIFSKEPRFIEIIQVWGRASTKCINRRYHSNTSSYDVY